MTTPDTAFDALPNASRPSVPIQPVSGGADQWSELEAKALAATEGPWMRDRLEPETIRTEAEGDIVVYETVWIKDAAFIAAANPATVLKLIAAARANSVGMSEANEPKPSPEVKALRTVGQQLVDALSRYGFPVSGGALPALTDHGSNEALALDFAARKFIAALAPQGGEG